MLPKTAAAKYAAANKNTTLLPNGKIRFDQTGMQFPSTVTSAVLNAYVNGKAFRRAIARSVNEAYDFSVHEPYIVPHRERDERHFLYCTLTKATLPRDSRIVQNHVSAKRFRRRLSEVEEAKMKELELAEKRREKRESAKLSRAAKVAEVEEAEGPMDEDNDVLDGIISDDDDSIASDENLKESRKFEAAVENTEGMSREAEHSGDMMEEDELEENEIEEDNDDERGALPRNRKSRRRSKKFETERTPKTKAVTDAPFSPKMEPVATGKRNRVEVRIPKKVQRARQRRKEMREA